MLIKENRAAVRKVRECKPLVWQLLFLMDGLKKFQHLKQLLLS